MSVPTCQYPTAEPFKDKTVQMKAVQWIGTTEVRVVSVPKPLITDPKDAIVKISSTSICGSDLHMYHNEVYGPEGSAMQKGDILGHECMGFVESVGPDVQDIKVGDRVVVSAVIACGECFYCKEGLFSCCDCTNPNKEVEKLYGHRLSGIFGYSHLTGGYPGGQAEFIRVPLADNTLLKVPEGLKDEQAVLLSDVCCTGFHANELGNVSEGQTVGVWGCGPVGLMALAWAKYRGAKRLIAIDAVPHRLQAARNLGAETINFAEKDVVETLHQQIPGGLDVGIDCVGFRFPKSLTHKIQRAIRLEKDTPEVLYEAIMSVRKGGVISVIGDYFGTANNFPIGALMEKAQTMRGGQVFVQKYWKTILGLIEKKEFDPSFIFTHVMPLEFAAEAYRLFDLKEDNCIKILLKPERKSAP